MSAFTDSVEKVAAALENNSKKFEELDSVAGDGDLGITAGNIAKGLRAGAAGATGQLALDSDWLYVCVGTNTWKRTALTSWV